MPFLFWGLNCNSARSYFLFHHFNSIYNSSEKSAAESQQPISATIRKLGVHEATLDGLVKRSVCRNKNPNLAAQYAWIKEHVSEYSLGLVCDILSIDGRCYYNWLRSDSSLCALTNQYLVIMIRGVFVKNRSSYGAWRIIKALLGCGILICRKRVPNVIKMTLCCTVVFVLQHYVCVIITYKLKL